MSRDPIVLLRPDKAGDAIKTLPVLRALRSRFPDRQLVVLCSLHNYSLLEQEPGIVALQLPEGWHKLPASALKNATNTLLASAAVSAIEVAIDLLSDPTPESQRLLLCTPAPRRYQVQRPNQPLHDSIHPVFLPGGTPAHRDESTNIAYVVSKSLGLEMESFSHTVEISATAPIVTENDRAYAASVLPVRTHPLVGVCPFAGTAQRSPDLRPWKRLLGWASHQYPEKKWILFCPASQAASIAAIHPGPDTGVEVLHPPTFRHLAACFERLDALLAVDSGPLHLALAMGLPSLGFLSGGDQARWFAKSHPGDRLIRRGLLSRFPSTLEMRWACERWFHKRRSFSAVPLGTPAPA